MQINSRMTRSGEEVATRTLHAVLAVVALGVFVFSGAPVLAQDGTAQPERWWLDRAEEIEQFMRDAEVVDIEDIGEGVTNPKRAELAPGGPVRRITFKPIRPGIHRGFYDAYTAEVAAYELDKLLELAMVAPVVEKYIGGETGAAVMWVESAKSIKEMGGFPKKVPRSQAARWNQQLIRAKMFHNLVGNTDPNQGNWLVAPGWNLVPRSETHLVFFPAFDELGVAMPVAPRDVSQDRPAAVLMVRIVGVGQREIADAREDRFDPIQPRGVGRREHELHVVVGGPVGHLASRVRREVVEDEVEARRERVARAEVLEEQQHFATSLAAVAPHHESVVRDVVRREVLAGAMAAPVRGAQPRRVPDPAPRTAMVGAHFDGPEFVETDHAGVRRRGLVERTDAFFWRQSRGRGSPSRSSCVGTRTPGRAGCGPAWWRAAP